MSVKRLLAGFVTVFAVTLIVSLIVTFLWNLAVHGALTTDWETSIRFAIVLGIVLSWMDTRRSTAT
jgi:hypothetical protein